MRVKALISVVAASALTLSSQQLSAGVRNDVYKQALKLYENGMYERARTIFESVENDPLCEGYAALCALKMRSDDYPELVSSYNLKYPSSTLSHAIHYENGLRLFDLERYDEAMGEFDKLNEKDLPVASRPEYIFKTGYCDFTKGNYPEAINNFTRLDGMKLTNFTAPARYLNGVMNYNTKNFKNAVDWFEKAKTDPRFSELCDFYLVDSKFNLKDYDYVIYEGAKLYDNAPAERQQRLSRILSESYLVQGDTEMARKFYESSYHEGMTRSDYFYAGSVLYAVNDFEGAIDNFTRMPERMDSLGQVANYQLANAYIHTRNKVAAMDAFRDASVVEFDPEITEDAMFNYAKLAFDLNKDTGGFARYIKTYGTKTRGEQIYGYMALADLVDRDYAAAIEAYDNIDELDDDMRNNYTKANYLRAEQLVSNGAYSDAIPFLRATAYYLPKNDRFNQLARYWLGESYYRAGDYDNASKTYTELYNGAALSGLDEGKLLAYNTAYSYLSQKDYGSAAKWFDTYIRDGEEMYREDALTRRADCDFLGRDYKNAINSYQKVNDEFGSVDNIWPYYRQALAYGLTGNRSKKISTLKQVEKATPTANYYNEALYELGRAYMDNQNNDEATRVFEELKAKSTDKGYVARALIGLGMVSRNKLNYDKALGYYKEVVSTMPGTEYSEDALLAIESIYTARRQPEKYLEYLEENKLNSGKTDAEKAQIYFNTVEQSYLAENYQQAVASAQDYIAKFPEGESLAQAYYYMGDSYKEMGEKEKAIDAYAKAASASAEGGSFSERARRGYAETSYSLERWNDAYAGYAALLNSAKMDENKAVARAGMMRSAYKGKNYDQAISAAEVVKENNPSDLLKKEADYISAKSYMATSRREEALAIFSRLAANPSTDEGAEAQYILIQDTEDKGKFEVVEGMVYDFAQNAGDQSYWLAKAYITLGDSFAERGKYEQAKATFESVRDGYKAQSATDDVADNVNMRLERLAILMKKK